MAKISNKKYAQALYEMTAKADQKEIEIHTKNFFNLLIKNKNLRKIEAILVEYEKIMKANNKILDVEIITAHVLNQNIKDNLITKLKQEWSVDNINLSEQQDKQLIGGFILKINDLIIDNSLKTRLDLLKQKMNS